jgi:16S rRNA (adenine1518-N6/adenine1519-N6)-dimethyltransferase
MTVQELLRKYRVNTDARLGQNFLMNEPLLKRIADFGELVAGDVVLEIGPGLGVLTKYLTPNTQKVVSIELDERYVKIVRAEMSEAANYRAVHGNILDFSNQDILDLLYDHKDSVGDFKVIANIPYNITAPIVRKFTEQEPAPSLMVYMVQKEVAQRLSAQPGDMSVIAVTTQYYSEVEMLEIVPAADFHPAPKVDSAVIRLRKSAAYTAMAADLGLTNREVFRYVKIGFSARRKMLRKNLIAGLRLEPKSIDTCMQNSGLSLKVRAQELSVENWIKLAKSLKDLEEQV